MSDAATEWTIGRLIEWTRAFFEKKGIDQPRLESEILLAHVLGLERIALYMNYELPVTDEQRTVFRDLVRRRSEREPTRYLIGGTEFMSLAMKVTPACLIPRPETERLVEEVLALAGVKRRPPGAAAAPTDDPPRALKIIDLCTGCGCIAVSLAAYLPGATVTATDISAEALEVARENAQAHGVADRVALLEGDLYEPLDAADVQPADFLVANPPYVAEGEWPALAPEIREHEPCGALVAGPRGTETIEPLLKGAPAYLVPGGALVMEIGCDQGAAVAALAAGVRGLEGAAIIKDYAGRDRFLLAKKPACG